MRVSVTLCKSLSLSRPCFVCYLLRVLSASLLARNHAFLQGYGNRPPDATAAAVFKEGSIWQNVICKLSGAHLGV